VTHRMDKKEALKEYFAQLYRWNEKINLTNVAREKAGELFVRPSLAMLEFIEAKEGLNVFDIGSGGGIPAVILAIELPSRRFTLIESNGKKAVFLKHAAGVAGLDNVTVVNMRAENAAALDEYRRKADVITSRAVKRETVLNAAKGLLNDGGIVLIHKSPKDGLETEGFEKTGENEFVVRYERA